MVKDSVGGTQDAPVSVLTPLVTESDIAMIENHIRELQKSISDNRYSGRVPEVMLVAYKMAREVRRCWRLMGIDKPTTKQGVKGRVMVQEAMDGPSD